MPPVDSRDLAEMRAKRDDGWSFGSLLVLRDLARPSGGGTGAGWLVDREASALDGEGVAPGKDCVPEMGNSVWIKQHLLAPMC